MRSEISTGEKATGLATSTVVCTLPRWWLEMVNCRGSSGFTQIMGEGTGAFHTSGWCVPVGLEKDHCGCWLANRVLGGVMKLGSPWGGHWGAWGKVDDTGDGEKGLSRKTYLTRWGWVWDRGKNQGRYLSFHLELLGAIYQGGEEEQIWGSSGALRLFLYIFRVLPKNPGTKAL